MTTENNLCKLSGGGLEAFSNAPVAIFLYYFTRFFPAEPLVDKMASGLMIVELGPTSKKAEQPFSPITANTDNTVLASMLARLRAGLLTNIMRFLDSESEGKQLQSLEATIATDSEAEKPESSSWRSA